MTDELQRRRAQLMLELKELRAKTEALERAKTAALRQIWALEKWETYCEGVLSSSLPADRKVELLKKERQRHEPPIK